MPMCSYLMYKKRHYKHRKKNKQQKSLQNRKQGNVDP